MDDSIKRMLEERYPFLCVVVYAGTEYVGIIQNRDDTVTTLYDFGCLTDHDSKTMFLDLGAVWWWESNRSIPINIFLKSDWIQFRGCLKTFVNRDLDILHGPVCQLQNVNRKKHKRRSIVLVSH